MIIHLPCIVQCSTLSNTVFSLAINSNYRLCFSFTRYGRELEVDYEPRELDDDSEPSSTDGDSDGD